LTAKLRMADASVERARALEDTVKSADEKVRIAGEEAQAASNRIMALQNQLQELKKDIATRKRNPPDVSDQEIVDMMTKLNHLVQNWCVSSFRKIKIGMSSRNLKLQYVLTCSQIHRGWSLDSKG
jgi:phage shock protein A